MPEPTVNMPSSAPSRKVTAAGAAGVVAGLILWLLDAYVFGPGREGDVPGPVSAFVFLVVPGALAYGAGYLVKRRASELSPGRPG